MCSWEAVAYQYLLQSRYLQVPFAKPISTNTLWKADTYQYPLQSRHLPVPLRSQHLPVLIARPSSTSTLRYKMTPSIVQGADFSKVRGVVFSIVQGAVFNIVQAAVFSIVRSDAFSIIWDGAFQCYGLRGDVRSEPFV